ncbi:MAG: GNAT family N-acetyltransferase [Clostridia bacterium]|nr:GNAT family N-acetyltransferase [Clostridia bacterium]
MSLTAKNITRALKEYPQICELMKTAFPADEQLPMWLLRLGTLRRNFNFRAFYDEEQFCGIMYTVESEKMLFVLFLAVNDKIRSKGYGSKILGWLKENTAKPIALNVESPDPQAENALQREKRIEFYKRNGIVDTGRRLTNRGVNLSVLSNADTFDVQEYERLISSMALGLQKVRTTD